MNGLDARIERQLQEQAELTTLYAQGLEVPWPCDYDYPPLDAKPERFYAYHSYAIPCQHCGEMTYRYIRLQKAVCYPCQVERQLRANREKTKTPIKTQE